MLRILSHPLGPLPSVARRTDGWSSTLDAALVAAPGADELAARLRQPGAMVVTTGQQPGLFTGPLYTVYKALGAAAIARELEARWQVPVLPLFWVAGDDHDFAEASVAHWPATSGGTATWALPPRDPAAPQLPMTAELLPTSIREGIAELAATLPAGESQAHTIAWLTRHYVPGATLHTAYAGAVAELLAPLGILTFDPTHAAVKRAQVPVLQQALDQAASLDQMLAALPDPRTGIAAGEGATLVFVETAAGRERLMIDGDGFRTRRSGDRFSRTDIAALLQGSPERFSANVLLRPVVESRLLPTVAYVAGPGELKYLRRQAFALYPAFDATVQTPLPRWSGTVVSKTTERLLGRLHTTDEAVLLDDGRLGRAILERAFPGDARQAIDALRQQVKRSGSVLIAAGKRTDPVLDRAMKGRVQRLEQLTTDVEQLLLRHLRKRDDTQYAQYQRVRDALLPTGKLQERVLVSPAYLGRFGSSWLDAVVQAMQPWAASLPTGSA
ncbi:MAG TPA: bacillithiol biosynthesis cysteine-adding enzyme BshC [Gemmatimonadales bacterium]|jgi:bacillithiol biosynthesis cysteine-adding enzyme BshC